ncbi:hypothetical protein F66182_593 [Fusarium sp. NRRL 66182]|nr:hypothetical protein F66182_593 [Fusarium sp. NRRL 66182]
MPPVHLGYLASPSYERYLNGGVRPDELLPPLDYNEDKVMTVVGERYCRYRMPRGELCPKGQQFNTHSGLRSHYKKVHKRTVFVRRLGALNAEENAQVQYWYDDLVAGRMPSWPLRAIEETPGGDNQGRNPAPAEDMTSGNDQGDKQTGGQGCQASRFCARSLPIARVESGADRPTPKGQDQIQSPSHEESEPDQQTRNEPDVEILSKYKAVAQPDEPSQPPRMVQRSSRPTHKCEKTMIVSVITVKNTIEIILVPEIPTTARYGSGLYAQHFTI